MKKLFALLLITPMLFIACGDEEEDEKPYFNPVEGEWVDIIDETYITTRTFSRNFNASLEFSNNEKETKFDLGKYTINEEFIQYKETGNKHHYRIIEDTLHLRDYDSDWEKKYIRKR